MILQSDSPPTAAINGLASRSVSALKWNYLGAGVKVVSQVIIGIILARLLGPQPFGQIAIAWVLLGLGNLLADSGLTVALIQKPNISLIDVRYVFTIQVCLGLLLTLLTLAVAPFISAFFNLPDLGVVLCWMGLLFLLQSFGQTSSALLRRNLDHKRVQLIQATTYLGAYLILAVPLAYAGFGVWSLVTAQLTQAALSSLFMYLSKRHPIGATLKPEQSGLLTFGSKVLASNLTSWGISNVDSIIVGRILGATNLGLYSRSMSLLTSPMNATVSALQGVLMPLISRSQHEPNAAGRIYLAAICLMTALLAPIFVAVACVPQTVVFAIYGSTWSDAVPIITPLALAMPVNALLALGGPVLQGLGLAGREALSQAISLFTMVVCVSAGATISLEVAAWVVLAIYCLRAVLVTHLSADASKVNINAILRALAGPILLSLLAAFVSWQTDSLLLSWSYGSGVRLICILCLNAVVIPLVLLVAGPWLLCPEARSILLQVRPHLPTYTTGILTYWSHR
jgi:O-antigen/teichoic acid export membrane protein